MFTEWLAVYTLLTLPILAGFMRAVFWRADRNFTEHLAMCLYAYGQSFLFQALLVPLYESSRVVTQASAAIPFVVLAAASVQFLAWPRWWWARALLSVLAQAAFMIVLMFITVAVAIGYIAARDVLRP